MFHESHSDSRTQQSKILQNFLFAEAGCILFASEGVLAALTLRVTAPDFVRVSGNEPPFSLS